MRCNPKFLFYARCIQLGIGHGIDQGDPVIDQLRHVLVTGRYQHFVTLVHGPRGQCSNHIIRFDVRLRDQHEAQCANHRMQGFDLYAKLIRHGRTVSLVVTVQFVPEVLSFGIKDHCNVARMFLAEQLPDHIDDAVYGAGRLSG